MRVDNTHPLSRVRDFFTLKSPATRNIRIGQIIKYGQWIGSAVLILAIYFGVYYNLKPLSEPGRYFLYFIFLSLSWVALAIIWRRSLSIFIGCLPILFSFVFFYSGLGRTVGERGFVETRAPFTEYEERCRSRSYSADGHRIEFCEIIHSDNGVLADIMRDEGGPPWTREFLDSAIFRSALEFHATSSPESMIFNINEMVSSLSQVKVSFASLGNGFYLVSYDPGY
ncbi:hypothetical protein M2310_003807 [Rhizobium leguminosarum]|uniref:Uncharacterized protein n=1 Tax=Rhizobium esperanzae TaxID=1967781 RepID=A0A7W6XWI6_9HYPH|nr:hypothetical protein [Rhizobium esperanzae]MDH6203126.1 hypothetical protein [Rhizobium leguminosarum]